MDYRLIDQGGKALYKSVLGLFGEERELNKVTGRLKEFVDFDKLTEDIATLTNNFCFILYIKVDSLPVQ